MVSLILILLTDLNNDSTGYGISYTQGHVSKRETSSQYKSKSGVTFVLPMW